MTATARVHVTSFHPGSFGGGVLIGRDADRGNGPLVRERIAAAVLPRAPVEGEFWRVTGPVERHPVQDPRSGKSEMLDHVVAAWAGPIAPKGDAIRRWIARHADIKGVGDGYAERLWDAHGPRLYDIFRQRDVGALATVLDLPKACSIVEAFRLLVDEITYRQMIRGARESSFLVRSMSLLSRPDLAAPRPRRAAEGMGGAEPPGATRSALLRASMARMASTGPSPQRAPWHTPLQSAGHWGGVSGGL